MSTLNLIITASIISGVLSMIGGIVLLGKPSWVRRFSIHFISFAAGTLLATALLNLLPEAIEHAEEGGQNVFPFVLGGVVIFFLIERLIFHFHKHTIEDTETHGHATPNLLLIGDGVHNFVDGAILAAAFLVNPGLGVAAALSVAAHELPQEISDFSLMLHHGWSRAKVFWSNLGVSLTNLLGAMIVYTNRESLEPLLPYFLAFTAGIFIYISASDLLPEISSHRQKDKTSHIILLLLIGIAVIWAFGYYEIGHFE